MSEGNIETVRRHNEAWNRRDLTAWLDSYRSDAAIDWSRSRGPLKGVYRGRGELETFWDAFWSIFEDVQVQHHGFTEVGSEVVIPNTAHIRGRQGIEVVARSTFVFTVENGQTTRQRLFQERAEALEAARAVGIAFRLPLSGHQPRSGALSADIPHQSAGIGRLRSTPIRA